MSALPARRLKLADRGLLEEGMKADVVIFNPAVVRDAATYENPHQYAEGFSRVIVNGAIVFEEGAMTPARPGRVLRAQPRTASRRPSKASARARRSVKREGESAPSKALQATASRRANMP